MDGAFLVNNSSPVVTGCMRYRPFMVFCAPYCNAYIPDLPVFYNTRPGCLSAWQGTTGSEDQDAMAVAC